MKKAQRIGTDVKKVGDTIEKFDTNYKKVTNFSEVDEEHQDHLDISAAAYDGTTPEGYTKHEEHSNSEFHVFENDETGDIHIGYKGTDPTHIDDLIADGYILTGNEDWSLRHLEAEEHYLKMLELFPDRKFKLQGHSLGGNIALWVGCRHNVHSVVTFNMGVNPQVEWNRDRSGCETQNMTHYHVLGDPISTGALVINSDVRVVLPKGRNPHSLDNFYIEDFEDSE